jgi:LPS sulfotransferase NodH
MSHSNQLHGPIDARPETEEHYKEALLSPEWDVGDGSVPRLKYAIFYLARTGSVFLSASLRRRGIGVALEYLGASSIAARLGCLDEAGNTPLGPYFAQLCAKRTTPNGIFGIKVHPLHLISFAQGSIERAADFFHYFDRVLVLRRRDKLLQAISLVRAQVTKQFHLFAGDAERRLTQPDNFLFGLIAVELASTIRDEQYMERVLALVDPRKVTKVWYEELSESAIDGIAAGLTADAGHAGPTGLPYTGHALPRRGNADEALNLKRRFLAYIGAEAS